MPHESRNRISQRKFIYHQPRWITISKSRRRIILRVKPISGDTMQKVYRLPSAWKHSSGINPKRRKIAPTIERLNRCSVLGARHVLLESIRD
jgi:hypothetical protein